VSNTNCPEWRQARPRRSPGGGDGLALKPSREEAAQLRPGSRSRVVVVGQQHSHDFCPRAELRQVEGVGCAGVNVEPHHTGRLPLRQLGAVRRGGHLVLRANENKRRDGERRAVQVGAGGIESGSRLETGRAAARDLERGVASLGKPNDRDFVRIDIGKTAEIGESAIRVGEGLLEVDGAGLLEAARGKIVDEQGDIAPSRDPRAERSALCGQAETGVQKNDGREGTRSPRPRQIALDRVALTGAGETDQLVRFGGSAGQAPE
jgi:hypothetical protein